jgi:hypothetical protein
MEHQNTKGGQGIVGGMEEECREEAAGLFG